VDVVSLFSLIMFSAAWWFYARTPASEQVVKLLLGSLMLMAAGVGLLGFLNRCIMAAVSA